MQFISSKEVQGISQSSATFIQTFLLARNSH